jgi:hypothetical protein
MKAHFSYSLLFLLLLSLFCCSQEKRVESKILARINDYNLTIDEFHHQLAAELEFDKDFKLTEEAKQEFLEELIVKELLIQEAKKLKLDRKDKFIRTIERYWESTLIRDLMDLKSKEIQKDIGQEIKEQKKTRMLEEWIGDLRKNAKIEIDQELFYKN